MFIAAIVSNNNIGTHVDGEGNLAKDGVHCSLDNNAGDVLVQYIVDNCSQLVDGLSIVLYSCSQIGKVILKCSELLGEILAGSVESLAQSTQFYVKSISEVRYSLLGNLACIGNGFCIHGIGGILNYLQLTGSSIILCLCGQTVK